ncbi:MAG: serine--tRNA ligase [Gammaproteobacteria bacterium]|nr:serine--tRNA ligase [Gammaproteobacteria bacterium]
MLDPRLLRSDLIGVTKNLLRRGFVLDNDFYQGLENERKTLQSKVEELRHNRKERSKAIGQAKAAGNDIEPLKAEVENLGSMLSASESRLRDLQIELDRFLSEVPNLLHESVPSGLDEGSNEVIRSWGNPRDFSFKPKDHVVLGEGLGLIDFDAASKISGSRFVVLRGVLARLHRALTQLMLDIHIDDHSYIENYVPYLVNDDSLFGTGQLPKFSDDLFSLSGEKALRLIPTAEVPLSNLVRDCILEPKDIPMRLVAHTPCFRSEAGSYGRDTRGMIRQHQFEKVELVHITSSEDSYRSLEELLSHAEVILQRLELPYRVMSLCAGDTGFSSAKTYDIEVWLPGQEKYREISSCSNCESFQTRRMHSRWRNPETGKPELLHTLNGSGVAVGRALIAVMENYQQEDGTVTIPEVLRPYMSGLEKIKN